MFRDLLGYEITQSKSLEHLQSLFTYSDSGRDDFFVLSILGEMDKNPKVMKTNKADGPE